MFYSEDDIRYYEEEIDLSKKVRSEQLAAQEAKQSAPQGAFAQESERTGQPPAQRRKTGLRRLLAAAAAAVVISTGSIAVYDRAFVQPRLGRLSPGGSPTEQEIIFRPVSYGNKMTVPEIIEKAKPSVVSISTSSSYDRSTGSGVIMTEDGKILTNEHVIAGASTITVRLSSGEEYDATLLASDTKTDLAVLQIETSGLTPAEFGNSDAVVQGEIAVAIGSPISLSLEGSVTQGIISAVSREIVIKNKSMTYIQTDAAINPGNSGGALVNGNGQVIGINSAKVTASDVEGLGFSIPINIALPVAQELIEHGYVTGRPSIGISVQDLSRYDAAYYRVPQGVHVILVTPDSAADQAGLLSGDIIVGINGMEITSSDELNNEKDKFNPGDTIELRVFRSGQYLTLSVELGETVIE